MAFPHPLHASTPASATRSLAHRSGGYIEGGHQLEKLQFALAVANSRADHDRAADLRSQILALGGNQEEPGT